MSGALIGRRRRKARPRPRKRFAEVGGRFVEGCIPWHCRGIEREESSDRASRRVCFDVADLIARDCTATGLKPEIRDGLQDHLRIGLAPRMTATVLPDAVKRMIGAGPWGTDRRQSASGRANVGSAISTARTCNPT
jgi:hypothetical protein